MLLYGQHLESVCQFSYTLPEIGYKMKTGLTVDFRNQGLLRSNPGEGIIPLFYSQHIQEGMVNFPIKKENEYISSEVTGLMQKNKNYLFVKRFTAKEERRRLQAGIYSAQRLPQYHFISTQNKINFIDSIDGSDIPLKTVYFIESVTSVGPMDPKRVLEIKEMTKGVTSGKIYVTAFLDFKTYKQFALQLAWDTEVWLAELPEHMIHLNGDRFMGPRD